MKKLHLLLVLIFLCFFGISQETHTVSGYVKDAESGEALIGATIYLQEQGKGAATNVYGFYSFTVPSGKAHWEILLRSRAIENGLFVVATNMCGTHHGNRKTYGHSMLINPWGDIISKAKSQSLILNTSIDLREIKNIRNKIPSILNA